MKQIIYKYQLPNRPGSLTHTVPEGREILSIKKQDEKAVLYVKAPVAEENQELRYITDVIHVYETGNIISIAPLVYLESILFDNDMYVLHYFLDTEK